MQKTTNYNLNQWEASDRVTRADFNADNAAIDAALKSVADAAGNCKIALGSYVGTGTYGSANPNTLTFGFEPKMLVIIGKDNNANRYHLVAIAGETECSFIDYYTHLAICHLTWGENSVSWYGGSWSEQVNQDGATYHYVVLG